MKLKGQRVAVLFDDRGNEVYRGSVANIPVRFWNVSAESELVTKTVAEIVCDGVPVDPETDNELEFYECLTKKCFS